MVLDTDSSSYQLLANCGLVFDLDQCKLAIDPFFRSEPADLIAPSIKCDSAKELLQDVDIILLSHWHPDHFSIPSLAFFNRLTPIVIPFGDQHLATLLGYMGFQNIHQLSPWQSWHFRSIVITATPSAALLPEVGYIIDSSKSSFWHVVDTYPDETIIKIARKKLQRVPKVGFFALKAQRESKYSFGQHVAVVDPEIVKRSLAWTQAFPEVDWIPLEQGWKGYFFPFHTQRFSNHGVTYSRDFLKTEKENPDLNCSQELFCDPNPFKESTESLKAFVTDWATSFLPKLDNEARDSSLTRDWKKMPLIHTLEVLFPDNSAIRFSRSWHNYTNPEPLEYLHRIGASILKGVHEGTLSGSGAVVGGCVRINPICIDSEPLIDPFFVLFYPRSRKTFYEAQANRWKGRS